MKIDFTQEQVDEVNRCAGDCVYFLENYMKIITLDHGLVTFKPRKYQKDIVQIIDQNRFTILKLPRQCGKSTIVVSYLLWKVLFTADQNIGIIANRGKLAAELLGKLRLAYEYIPFWMQQGITEWNKGNIALENNSKIQATAAVRGESYNCVDRDTLVTVRRGDLVRHLTIFDLYELTRRRIPLDKYKERKEGRRPLFIDNKYRRAYDRLMEKARNRGRVDGYTEKHHVVPRSIDPASTDTVTLTAREHYVAHRLLVKFTSGMNKSKMVMALHMMSTCSKEKRRLSIPSRTYQRIREEYAKTVSETMRGRIFSKDHRRKIGEARRGMTHTDESKKKMSKSQKGRRYSLESRMRMSEARKGKKMPPEFGMKLSLRTRGRKNPWNQVTNRDPIKIKKTAETHRGMKRSIESRKKMSNAKRGKSPWNDGLVFPDFRRRHFHNPETGQRLFMDPALGIPDGFVPGRGSLPRAR